MNINGYRENIKKSMDKKQWEQCIRLSEEFKQQYPEAFGPTEYRGMGKCCRFSGRYREAREILKEGAEHHPDHKPLRIEQYTLAGYQKDWEEAAAIAREITEDFEATMNDYYRLGKAHQYLDQKEAAEKWFIKAIEKNSEEPMESFIKALEKQSGLSKLGNVQSRYSLGSGKNNLGLIVHIVNNSGKKEFITKIIREKKTREGHFYQKILKDYPGLGKVAPKILSVIENNQLQLIVMEKIPDDAAPAGVAYFKALGNLYREISSVKYFDGIESYLQTPKYSLALKENKSQALSNYFMTIHREETSRRLFKLMEQRLKEKGYKKDSFRLFEDLREVILDFKSYKGIKPRRHYSLIHGDMGRHNLLFDGEKPRVVDWNTYKAGPRWYDFANGVAKEADTAMEVAKALEKLKEIDLSIGDIESIFYYYAVVLIWFQGNGQKKFETSLLSEAKKLAEQMKLLSYQRMAKDCGEKGYRWKKKSKHPAVLSNLMILSRLPWRKGTIHGLHRAYSKILINRLSGKRKAKLLLDWFLSPLTTLRDIQGFYRSNNEKIRQLSGKPLMKQWAEQLYLSLFYSITVEDYYRQGFFNDSSKRDLSLYLKEGVVKRIIYPYLIEHGKIIEQVETPVSLGNKLAFERHCKKHDLPSVTTRFMIGEGEENKTGEQLARQKKEFLEDRESFFIKPNIGKEGHGAALWTFTEGVYINHLNQQKTGEELWESYQQRAREEKTVYLIQPIIKPHRDLSLFYHNATPTGRLITYIDPKGTIGISQGMLRFNLKKDSIVDNASVGGTVAPIDIKKGTVSTVVIPEPVRQRFTLEEFFPGKGVSTVALPYWEEAKALVIAAHGTQPYRKIIGWDMIITEEGPLLVEGNSQPGIAFVQAAQETLTANKKLTEALLFHTKKAMKLETDLINYRKKPKPGLQP